MRYEITCKAPGHGFTLYINNSISQIINYDPETGTLEFEVFEQVNDIPNAPRLVSSLSLTIRPKANLYGTEKRSNRNRIGSGQRGNGDQ